MFTWRAFRGSANGIICEHLTTRGDLIKDEVLLEITAAGLCGTDAHFRTFDMVLGHEGIGIVLQIGPEVRTLRKGDRVGWGYQHDSCGLCQVCLEGEEVHCDLGEVYGDSNLDQGAFATNAIWREAHLLRIPDNLSDVDAAPLMCAGNAVFSALATMDLTPGAKVGVLGMGGLGHLAIQFAAKQGFKVTVLSRTEEKEKDALDMGAKEFRLFENLPGLPLGEPLDALLITASHFSEWHQLPDLMAPRGTIALVSIFDGNITIPALSLVARNLHYMGCATAPRGRGMKMLQFASETDIRPRVERFPLTAQGISKAMRLMRHGQIRYRAVFTRVGA